MSHTATMFVNHFIILLPSFYTLVHRLRRMCVVIHILHLLFLLVEKSSTTFIFLPKVIISTWLLDTIVSVSVDLLLFIVILVRMLLIYSRTSGKYNK